MAVFERLERHSLAVTAGCVAATAGLLALHYGTTLHRLGVHDVLRGLFYVPVALAAVVAGWRGGVVTASVAAIGYVPHIRQLAQAGDRAPNNVLELLLMIGVGALVGTFADASRRLRALAAERGRLAALGEVGLGVMVQAEGPLAAIEGQAVSLRLLARRGADLPVEFAAGIIQEEAAQVRRLMSDLHMIGTPQRRRSTRVNLSALLAGLVGDLTGRSAAGSRVLLGPVAEHITIHGDRRVLSWSFRALIFGLLASDPPPCALEVNLAGGEREAILGIRVSFAGMEVPDLERTLSTVFGAATTEYQFERALCLHLLAAEGARIRCQRIPPRQQLIQMSFPLQGSPGGRPPRSRPAQEDREAGLEVGVR